MVDLFMFWSNLSVEWAISSASQASRIRGLPVNVGGDGGGRGGDGEGRAGLLYEAGLGFGTQAFDSRETTLNHDRCQV